jgi:phage-related protein
VGVKMNAKEYKALFYDLPNGTEPAKDFIKTLDDKMYAKMLRTINILEDGGTMVREPYSKHLDDGIFEVRAKIGSDISRVLYFFFAGKKIILTHGFIKKTQKTPSAEIKLAKKYRAEYLNREAIK